MNSRAVLAPTSRVGARAFRAGPAGAILGQAWSPGAPGSGLSSARPPLALLLRPPGAFPAAFRPTHTPRLFPAAAPSSTAETRSPRCILLRASRRQPWSSRRPSGPGALCSSSLSHHRLLVHSPRHPTPDSLPADLRGDPVSPDLSLQTCPCIWK